MKVLLLSFSIYPSYHDGIVGIAEGLSKSNYDVCTCYDENSSVQGSSKSRRIKVPQKNGLCKGLFNFKELLGLIRWIKREAFDVIYIESVHLWNIFLLLFCRKTVFLCAIHDVKVHDGDKHAYLLNKLYEFEIRKSKYVIVRNKTDVNQLCLRYCIPRELVRYIPLNYPFPKYVDNWKRKKRVLFFGRINPYKGIDNLLSIAKLLPDITFIVYGKSTSSVIDVLEECKALDNIEIHDKFVDYKDMRDIFSMCDCVVLPYKSASQSGVIIDAYRFSKPVIAFNVGAFNEEVVNNITGFLVKPGDIDGFAKAILQLESLSEIEYRKMIYEAYSFGYKMFSNNAVSQCFIDIVEEDYK